MRYALMEVFLWFERLWGIVEEGGGGVNYFDKLLKYFRAENKDVVAAPWPNI